VIFEDALEVNCKLERFLCDVFYDFQAPLKNKQAKVIFVKYQGATCPKPRPSNRHYHQAVQSWYYCLLKVQSEKKNLIYTSFIDADIYIYFFQCTLP
jgi:hypothetical protein